MPGTVLQLNILCAECGKASEWFDPDRVSKALYATDRASDEHGRGFICEQESRSARAVKLLIHSEQGINERAEKGEAAWTRARAGWLAQSAVPPLAMGYSLIL
jgi:hypothetical protein